MYWLGLPLLPTLWGYSNSNFIFGLIFRPNLGQTVDSEGPKAAKNNIANANHWFSFVLYNRLLCFSCGGLGCIYRCVVVRLFYVHRFSFSPAFSLAVERVALYLKRGSSSLTSSDTPVESDSTASGHLDGSMYLSGSPIRFPTSYCVRSSPSIVLFY